MAWDAYKTSSLATMPFASWVAGTSYTWSEQKGLVPGGSCDRNEWFMHCYTMGTQLFYDLQGQKSYTYQELIDTYHI